MSFGQRIEFRRHLSRRAGPRVSRTRIERARGITPVPRRGTQVAKGRVCKTLIQRFESAPRLQLSGGHGLPLGEPCTPILRKGPSRVALCPAVLADESRQDIPAFACPPQVSRDGRSAKRTTLASLERDRSSSGAANGNRGAFEPKSGPRPSRLRATCGKFGLSSGGPSEPHSLRTE